MKNDTKKIIASVLTGSAIIGGSVMTATAPREIPLTDAKVYVMSEILQGRTPRFNLDKFSKEEIVKAYSDVSKLIGVNLNGAVAVCLQSRKADDCNLYNKIGDKLNENVGQ